MAIKIDEGFMALESLAGAEAMDDRLAEHVLDRRGHGLGSVEDGQGWACWCPGRGRAAPVIRPVATAAFSVEPPSAATNRPETADFGAAAATSSTARPGGLEFGAITPRRQAREPLLHRQPTA